MGAMMAFEMVMKMASQTDQLMVVMKGARKRRWLESMMEHWKEAVMAHRWDSSLDLS